MKDNWTVRWDERYSKEGFAYGKAPNLFLKDQLEKLKAGKILFPAEGEGRNAVFAAKLGWNVAAFDISIEGKKKAEKLSAINHVTIDYKVGELQTLDFYPEQFDAIALIYAHFPADIKSIYHQTLNTYLKPGGIMIFEAFSKKHINYFTVNEKVGGPKDMASLFSFEEIRTDFANYKIIVLEEMEIELKEGLFHNGLGSVIRFVGMKK